MPTHEWDFPASQPEDPDEPGYPAGHAILTTETGGTLEHPDGVVEFGDLPESYPADNQEDRHQQIRDIFGAEILRLAARNQELEAREARMVEALESANKVLEEMRALIRQPATGGEGE